MSMIYPEKERRIYGPYDDGTGGAAVFGDPHKINRTLIRLLDGDPNKWVNDYNSGDVVSQSEAANRLLAAAIEAFELKPFDKTNGSGLDEQAILKIFKHFSTWMKELKKKDEPTPIGSNVSDGPTATPQPINPGNPGQPPKPFPEKDFMDQREKDHAELKKRMGSISRVGLPSG